MTNCIKTADKSNLLNLDNTITEIKNFVLRSAQAGTAAHEVERELYRKVFELGLNALQGFFSLQGTTAQNMLIIT